MFRSCFLATALVATASAAFAEGGNAPQPLPPVTIIPAPHDWSGFYLGLGYSSNFGDIDFFTPDVPQSLDDGNGATAFAGYRMQNGNLVYGGELAYYTLNDQTITGFPAAAGRHTFAFDASAQVGYAVDQVLVFAQLGYSQSDYIGSMTGTWDLTGFNYGLGVDFAISDQFTIGLLYTARDLEGDSPTGSGQTAQFDLNSLTLRAAFRF